MSASVQRHLVECIVKTTLTCALTPFLVRTMAHVSMLGPMHMNASVQWDIVVTTVSFEMATTVSHSQFVFS